MNRLFILAWLALCIAAVAQMPKTTAFKPPDGNWWLKVSNDQRDSFLTGFFECYSFTLRKEVPSGPPGRGLSDAITETYEKGGGNTTVASVIQSLFDHWRAQHHYSFIHADPANEYDGGIWMGGDVKAGYRLAIVDGFLSCQAANHMPVEGLSPARLERKVSRWYGTGREETLAQKNDNDKLGAVILRAERQKP